ncbi:MAG TPA: membrane dipeptidase [Solirubrobacterales bacterium]|nr:membrane dipeptidase [Solirubrobacterales bacterium]
MLVDLHAHYPMHLIPPEQADTQAAVTARRPGARWKAIVIDLLSRRLNYEGPKGAPSVTVELMRTGDVGAVLSVLYSPLDEMDLRVSYGAPPRPGYIKSVLEQIKVVEEHVKTEPLGATVAHDAAALDAAIAGGRTAIVHCIEGGFALGATPAEIDANVAELARRGVVYVTLAHLFWRGVATNAPALPFMSDWLYRMVFPQPKVGLTELGTAAARALVRERVLVDITHMTERAIADTFSTVGPDAPVISSHMACRFGKLSYNLTDDVIREVGRRGGVMGVIACKHYTHDGLRADNKVKTFEDSMELVYAHIDRIRQVTGSHDHAAIGSDLDGWIKPALPGLEHLGRMRYVQEALAAKYGAQVAEKIANANLLALLRRAWR